MSTRKEEQAEATRSALVRTGRRLFARRGFDETSAEEIVEAAQLTRGALYHHFDGKEGLFREVLVEAMREVRDEIVRSARGARAPREAMERGVSAFLDACIRPQLHRILMIDGPAVLGWPAWRALDMQHGVGLLRDGLRAVAAAEKVALPDAETASHLIAGALIDGAMLIASAAEPEATRRLVEETVLRLVAGILPPTGSSSSRRRAR
jgi:AcrR family transcriptional regulator